MKKSNFIFIIGFMASGKSTFGKRIAKELDYQFIDTDVYISDKEKKSIPEIFDLYGEKYFRLLEKYALNDILEKEGRFIVSTGGGMACNQRRLNKMLKKGTVINLNIDAKSAVNRLKSAKVNRPLVAGLSEPEMLLVVTKLMNKRSKYYTQAPISINSLDAKKIDVSELL